MEKIDWRRKLSSRKFWGMIVNFITNILIAFNVADNVIVQVTAIILAGAGIIAYIFAEGWVDAKEMESKQSEYIGVIQIKED